MSIYSRLWDKISKNTKQVKQHIINDIDLLDYRIQEAADEMMNLDSDSQKYFDLRMSIIKNNTKKRRLLAELENL